MSPEYSITAPKRRFALANPFSVGSWRIWLRNRDAFLRLWKTELWPPFAEAVLTLFRDLKMLQLIGQKLFSD